MTESAAALPAGTQPLGPSAVAIGNFDGVHIGHQRILEAAVTAARRTAMSSVALTFDPHPLSVVAPARAPEPLASVAERTRLIRELGVDRVVVLPFTVDLSRLAPRRFAREVLAEGLQARRVVVGMDFRFGRGGSGDVRDLKRLGRSLGFDVEVVDTVFVGGHPVSSTRLRRLVREGRVSEARRLLGREFSVTGPIVRGRGIGSRQTVPTLNLAADRQVLPADGVYVSAAHDLDGRPACHESVTNVGVRPTFDGRKRTVETYLLGGLGPATPKAIELKFLRRIRDERKFPSAESLREQIQADIRTAERFFQRLRTLSAKQSRDQ